MKLLVLATAALVGVASALNSVECKKWHPKIYNRINSFCSKTNMVVPSTYAYNGAGTDATGRVWIFTLGSLMGGGCTPPQWVPSAICRTQFYKICGRHTHSAYYGRGLCQFWNINYAPGAVAPVKSSDGSTWYTALKKRNAEAEPLALPDVKKYKNQADAEKASVDLHAKDTVDAWSAALKVAATAKPTAQG